MVAMGIVYVQLRILRVSVFARHMDIYDICVGAQGSGKVPFLTNGNFSLQ